MNASVVLALSLAGSAEAEDTWCPIMDARRVHFAAKLNEFRFGRLSVMVNEVGSVNL